ncbi:PREDICTED: uncharacterized protein LOC108771920 [Cyphomyrmex costatus]|uniref:Zinc finger protein 28 like protein n=1 Tax=Cyphomyrmex costatus TaxID=456900 RepID=A0A195CYG8_9HYME|nr:PREDICTED: uncharacterized protein LOC108771920 [Cyphomyrmex costatus]XP_018392838.1 PREDICTED: uncharacterized protein LOC108771920 [Cyphomyrmex costatus]KYN05189.1 Zinc finger protein 28 like protein [Cyphomyrmex costatus]
MSVTSEPNDYGEVMSQGVIKSIFMENEPKPYTSLLNHESIMKNLTINEEIIVSTNGHLSDKVDCQTQPSVYFEENLETCNDTPTRFEESINMGPLSDESSITKKLDCESVETPVSKEDEFEEQEDDEETIATFVTAAGQQLALYAVEDSDEIFAVAVYDESDEPPTNFQFLMKSDVERLIGEGAVRTVKKPSQMKKRVFTAKPPMLCHKEEVNDKTSICDISVNSEKDVAQEDSDRIVHNYENYQNCSDKVNSESNDSVHTTVDEQADITYLMMNDNFVDIAEQSDECEDNVKFEEELIEYSTVQYILLEADQSDSELTFDDIQATLRNMKISREKLLEKSGKLQDDHSSLQQDSCGSSIKEESSFSEDADAFELYMSPQSTIDRTCISVSEDDRQRLIDTLTDSPPSTTDLTSQMPLKVKRSRKQQLILVDRDDGEIIIQPASMINDESTGKKRTTRRRRLSSQIRVAMANRKRIKRTRRIKRPKRRKVVEVIDLDIDEEEQQTSRNVVEITLDDNKDKCSSDKENEIIMVKDSDSSSSDHEENEKTEWVGGHLTKLNSEIRCEYCSRNFRYRRTLNMHLLVCRKKALTNTLSLDEEKPKVKTNKIKKKIKKQFTCKICQEKFDAVVVLARHVRLVHVQKKKNELSLSSEKSSNKSLRSIRDKEAISTEEEESNDEEDTTEKELSMLARVKRKRKQKNYSDTKQLDCAECGRWFPSTTLLNAHSLQHGTKRSEQLRKCHICKKYIKSRLLFLRHLRMHNDTQHTSGSSSKIMQRKLRARPSTHKIASPRKRGRPRKF